MQLASGLALGNRGSKDMVKKQVGRILHPFGRKRMYYDFLLFSEKNPLVIIGMMGVLMNIPAFGLWGLYHIVY